jgi:uncharacterized protein YndB with AHSA1/START domain/DNA-binding transcriptional ArsR family regulator
MEAILKALGDKTRRALLDKLRVCDGQTLTELESSLGMSRFGVMKHLKILEAAGLVLTHKSGRFKYHYLNAAPLQQVVDRWIEPLTQQPMARAVLDLKAALERNMDMATSTVTRPDFMMETFIRTTPEKLWEALTDPEMITRYHFASVAIHGRFAAGEPYEYKFADGNLMLSGEIIAADPPKRLEMSFIPGWMGPDAVKSHHVYEIEAAGHVTKLTILHFDLPESQHGVREGWAKIVASLKSYLETGEALRFGQ